MGLFDRRVSLKPYEYPQLEEFANAIRHSYWVHTEFNYTSDINDYLTADEGERGILRRAMLAIAQIEVNVKTFWGDLYGHMPKPEVGAVGFTFAESEVRHMDAYSHLIELLGLDAEFSELTKNEVIKQRIDYLNSIVSMGRDSNPATYAKAILMFSLFIENVSLFSQFLIIMAFNKHKNSFKGMSNAVEATSKEEQIHALFGVELVNILRKEYPDYFTPDVLESVREMAREALESEVRVIDWIYDGYNLSFLPKEVVIEFVKNRLNTSLKMVGIEPVVEIDNDLLMKSDWFDTEVLTTKHTDFFHKRSINYNKRSKSVTSDDLFS